MIIFIHESGHYTFSKIVDFKYSEIIIYPFGGITNYNEDLNVSSNKELFTLIGGITFQLLFVYLIFILYQNNYVTYHTYNIINNINKILISFNFLPILPLDGGKLINIILDKIFSYKLSFKISIIISIIFTLIFLISKRTYLSLLLTIFLIKCIIIEINNLKYKYNKFVLERYLNNYNFKRIKIINNINNLKRDNYHIINNMLEKKYLRKLFDRTEHLC
ncbi:MAG: hypothetical protein MR938_04870 [Tenericutes bacterium]|nr:hypothetical protein [Mycoplasmatota bacterium]